MDLDFKNFSYWHWRPKTAVGLAKVMSRKNLGDKVYVNVSFLGDIHGHGSSDGTNWRYDSFLRKYIGVVSCQQNPNQFFTKDLGRVRWDVSGESLDDVFSKELIFIRDNFSELLQSIEEVGLKYKLVNIPFELS